MTPVIFRVGKADGEVYALFPTIPSDCEGRFVTCYARVGQHGGADLHGCIRASRPAKMEEYAGLLIELESEGYDDLRVYRRTTPQHREAFRQALRETKELEQ